MSERSDSTLDLLSQARSGNDEALGRLYRRLLPAVRRWAHGRVPREARAVLDTQDLVQETLTRTLAQIRQFEPHRDRGLYLYLREALRNRVRDELRRVKRRPRETTEPSSGIPGADPDPLDRLIDDEALMRYERALDRLDAERRAMVVARLEFGLSWSEIAEIVGRSSPDAARTAVSRALATVAREVGDGC